MRPIGPHRCKIVQVQWSDIGGVVPEPSIMPSVADFGYDNMNRFAAIIKATYEGGSEVGSLSVGRLSNPLLPSWRQDPKVRREGERVVCVCKCVCGSMCTRV